MTTATRVRPPWLADIARDLPALMTIDEVAKILRVHPKTVSRWISDRTLKSVRSVLGSGTSRVTISRDAVLDWLAAHEVV